MGAKKVLFVLGTRPEAIKLCPVIGAFRSAPGFEVLVCLTAQHRDMLDQVLDAFRVKADEDLNLMQPGQTLSQTTARIITAMEPVMAKHRPDLVMVQGDTTTTVCGALAAFYARVPVGHVEAGLRTGDLTQPFPEELNRVLVTRLTALHFAATSAAADNLRAESVPEEAIVVTGNSGIDAVMQVNEALGRGEIVPPVAPELDQKRRLILVTAHRRESFGEPFEKICTALLQLAERPDVQIVYPVHPNPNVTGPVRRRLGGHPRIHLIDPLDYLSFVALMRRAHVLLTDSGGVQEEGPSLGKPVLCMREKTERPEAVIAGTTVLVGCEPMRIVGEVTKLLDDDAEYQRRSRMHNPYGDGHASERMVAAVSRYFERGAAARA
jgi:UDP-N-acetylglucosamine 2-epimerase (non-hydrolysing)